MTSQEFCIWLKGFTEGVHEFNVSPKQWDILKEKLAEVKDEEKFVFRGPPTSPFTPAPNPMWQQPHYPNPWDEPGTKYKVTCEDNVSEKLSKAINGGTGTSTTGKTLLKDSTYNYTLKNNDGKSV